MVSHEFRTPLTTIQFSAGLLQDYSSQWSEDKKSTHFVRIQLAIKRMTELLEDILVIGKIEANTLQFQPVSLNLEKFCRQLVEEQQLNDSNQHPIIFQHEGGNCDAQMDEKLLQQMLGNVLSNALKYSPVASTVSLHLNCKNKEAVFQVQDQGYRDSSSRSRADIRNFLPSYKCRDYFGNRSRFSNCEKGCGASRRQTRDRQSRRKRHNFHYYLAFDLR